MPLNLATYATPRFDYDAELGTGVPSQWDDQSGNGYHATQATGANQPVITSNVAAFGTRPAYRFDTTGGNKWWEIPSGAFTGLTECAIFMALVADTDPGASAGGFIKTGSSGLASHHPYSDSWIYDDFCTTARKGAFANYSSYSQRRPFSGSYAHIVHIRSKASDYSFMVDGQTLYETTTSTFGVGAVLQVGNSSTALGGAQQFIGYIARVFAVATVPSYSTTMDIVKAMMGYYRPTANQYPMPDLYGHAVDNSVREARSSVPAGTPLLTDLSRARMPTRRSSTRGWNSGLTDVIVAARGGSEPGDAQIDTKAEKWTRVIDPFPSGNSTAGSIYIPERRYLMWGLDAGNSPRTWKVSGLPDLTGSQSGYTMNASTIRVLDVWTS